MTALVVRANANRLPLADATVDLVVTSPPYFGLRSYQDGGEHYTGQVGDEATPQEFVAALLAVTAECVRVLKPSGSVWVNLGDSYFSGKGAPGKTTIDEKNAGRTARRLGGNPLDGPSFGVQRKSLVGLPWRYALACIDQLGLILRAEVIWSKPNGLPESVTDRVRRSHEQWFHFTKEPRYYSAVDEIREPIAPAGLARRAYAYSVTETQKASKNPVLNGEGMRPANDLGKLPGSVWTIPTQPLTVPAPLGVDHFAAFPMEWPRRIVQGWSPSGICTVCGEGRRPTVDTERIGGHIRTAPDSSAVGAGREPSGHMKPGSLSKFRTEVTITGTSCACATTDAPTRPAVVLDCFGGTGTTALVASALGRIGVSCDLSHDYSRLARWRTTDPGERAKAMRVDKPPVEVDGQADLFGETA